MLFRAGTLAATFLSISEIVVLGCGGQNAALPATTMNTGPTTDPSPGDAAGGDTSPVQRIVDAHCVACHGPAVAHGQLTLTDVRAVVGQVSSQCPDKLRIAAGDPAHSYLMDKLLGHAQEAGGCFVKAQMPKGGALGSDDIQTISDWIASGAP